MVPYMIRATACATSVGGYKIAKGTQMLMNFRAQYNDPELFPQPFECKPERFLTSAGKLVLPDEVPRKHLFSLLVLGPGCVLVTFWP